MYYEQQNDESGLTYGKCVNMYVFMIICLMPLFYLPSGYSDPFYLPKMIFWLISFLSVVIALILAKKQERSGIFVLANLHDGQKYVWIILFLYILAWTLSTIFSTDKVASLVGGYTFNGYLQLLMCIVTFVLIANHYQFETGHLRYVAATYIIVSVLAVLQFYRIDPLQAIYGEEFQRFGQQTFSTIGNQNQVATCLCVAFTVLAAFYITHDQTLKGRRLILFGIFVIFAGNVATYSKAGLIAICLALLIALPFIMHHREALKRYLYVVGGCLAIFIVMNLTSNAAMMNRLLQMFFESFEMTQGNVDATYGSGRMEIWINSIDLLKNHWIIGSGPDTFFKIYDAAGYAISAESGEKITVLSPHNESLRLIITTGIASLLLYWILILYVVKKGLARLQEDKMMLPFLLGLFCYEIKLMFNCSSITDIVIFWFLLAIVFKRATLLRDSK